MKDIVGVIIDFVDILEIYWILGECGKIWFVIVKFKNIEVKVNLIKYRLN